MTESEQAEKNALFYVDEALKAHSAGDDFEALKCVELAEIHACVADKVNTDRRVLTKVRELLK